MQRLKSETIRRWLVAFAWMALIFWLSAQPRLPGPPDPFWRFVFMKTAHFGAYGTLAVLYLWALGKQRRGWALGLALLYGLSDELHQSLVPGRTATLRDVVVDCCGAATALFVYPYLFPLIARKAQN